MSAEFANVLAGNKPLAERYRNRGPTGDWKNHCDHYVKTDLVPIYRKIGDDTLQLVRLGSHSELGL